VSAAPTRIKEGGIATYTVTASRVNRDTPTTVNYIMKGKALLGTHYTLSGDKGQVTIPAGQSSATVTLSALNSDVARGRKIARMVLTAGLNYTVTSPGRKARVLITNVR
jgi:hypothetical protein